MACIRLIRSLSTITYFILRTIVAESGKLASFPSNASNYTLPYCPLH